MGRQKTSMSGVIAAALLAALASLAPPAAAQSTIPPPAPAASGVPPSPTFKPEELEQLAAPIALYPDALVAQILMASTYPLEVVEAARWSKANPSVKEKALEDAMQTQTWDPSVKSLAAFPQVLAMMNDKLDWTQKLGDAFLAQQKDLMDAVQKLRAKAQAAGNLKSGKEQTVTTDQEGGSTVYVIEPASPEVVYVPTYNPTIVYGPWPYPGYPPYYYYPPGPPPGAVFFWFSAGIIIGGAMWGHCNWRGGSVNININNYNRYNRTNINNPNWQHNVDHRKGVQYRDTATQQRFGGGARPGADSREAFRGRAETGRQDIERGGGADKFGQAGAIGDRDTGAGNRAGGAGAFEGVGSGAQTRDFSSRGASSRSSAGVSRPSGGGGGMRGGGGGGMRGGGGRR